MNFTDFLSALLPPSTVVVFLTTGIMCLIFRSTLTKRFDVEYVKKEAGQPKIKDKPLCIKCLTVIFFVIVGFLLDQITGVAISLIAIYGAFALMLLARPRNIGNSLEAVEWHTLVFFAGLFVMVRAMREAGLINEIGAFLVQ